MSNAILKKKLVNDIKGNFFIPAYQRGYRWDIEAERLLDDIQEAIDSKVDKYCLQPIVVKKIGEDRYELIDGQQRLTTIYLIYKVISTEFKLAQANFTLEFETRANSQSYLETINDNSDTTFIDYFYIKRVYTNIKEWFCKKNVPLQAYMDIFQAFNKIVNVIWYEVGEDEDSNKLFQRLNIGKIPLTSAELVKAIFLNESNSKNIRLDKQESISFQWDNIEKELHNDSLWYFLTNSVNSKYQTRIDLVLDLMSKKKVDEKDKYFTFFYFDKERKNKELTDIWKEIQKAFLLLKDWYKDHDLYHKIGYLIASKSKSLQEIYDESQNRKKSDFNDLLDNFIKDSIKEKRNYGQLLYKSGTDYKKLQRILLLFNVESVRQIDEKTQRFPFDLLKSNNNIWSLEHIHAQNSEGLKNEKDWREWLELHLHSVEAIGSGQDLVDKIKSKLDLNRIERNDFTTLQVEIQNALSTNDSISYKHSIANLALLNTRDNAAINNSTFDVKRNIIVELDRKGNFIPYCTKMVFLKYYTNSAENSIHFWGEPDRNAYIKAINDVLKQYINEEIILQKEEE